MRADIARGIASGLQRGGASFIVYLPDSVFDDLEQILDAAGDSKTVVCAREDEGVAIAMGAALAGSVSVAIMEGSGVGLAGLILARCIVQRTGLLLLASHSRVLGETHDYHAASALAAEGILRGLDIPYVTVQDPARVDTIVEQALQTVKSQRIPIGVIVPSFEGSAS